MPKIMLPLLSERVLNKASMHDVKKDFEGSFIKNSKVVLLSLSVWSPLFIPPSDQCFSAEAPF